jgi:AcrR family transcriptional regulator
MRSVDNVQPEVTRKSDPGRMKPEMRARLRAAVLEAFSSEDFHNVDMRSIAARCGMSFSTIYKYFGDKEHLLFEFISEWLADLRKLLKDGMKGLESPREKLRRFLWINLQYYEEHPEIGRVMFMSVPLQTWMRDPTFRQAEFFHPVLVLVRDAQQAGMIDPDLQPYQVIDLFMGTIQHSIVMWEYRQRRYRLTDQFEPMFRILWSGIQAR